MITYGRADKQYIEFHIFHGKNIQREGYVGDAFRQMGSSDGYFITMAPPVPELTTHSEAEFVAGQKFREEGLIRLIENAKDVPIVLNGQVSNRVFSTVSMHYFGR